MDLYSKVLAETEFEQIRLTLNDFKGQEYIHIRKYYLDFDEQWVPTDKGISFPYSITIAQEIFQGFTEILAQEETVEILKDTFSEVINHINKEL
jgi:hypothetical protein